MKALAAALGWAIGAMPVVVSTAGAAEPRPRFTGLERLYFERIAGPAHPSLARSLHGPALRALLPETLDARTRYWEPGFPEQADGALVAVRDFRLPAPARGGEWLLREVRDASHRLAHEWWAVYVGGRRTDTWYFVPDPQRTDRKLLPNWTIDRVAPAEGGAFVVRISGNMSRPAGAWWTSAADLTFSLSGREMRLERVFTRFAASRDYDRGEGKPAIDVMTQQVAEGEAGPAVEVRRYVSVPEAVLKECARVDGAAGEDDEFDDSGPLQLSEPAARCVTARPEAKAERHPAREPSFAERGPRAPRP
jgi:hypothetical protein